MVPVARYVCYLWGRIDACLEIAARPEVISVLSVMRCRVPGRHGSMLDARRRGSDIRIVYSPLDSLKIAQDNPDKQVVFFGLGFETTMPSTAMTAATSEVRGLKNFSLFCQHITIVPTLRCLLEQEDVRIDGFIAPGHVKYGDWLHALSTFM